MLEDFLKKLGANTRITVGVSISPGIGLEMIEVDRATKIVNKYAYRPLEYNYSAREIVNYEQFQDALTELFEELHIPKKSNIVLNVPNVQFGIINLPLLLVDDAVTSAIVSESEQSYIFKRQEPVVSWTEVNSSSTTESRALAYTAIQQTAVDGFKASCQEVGCTLIAIETSYASFLKALYYTEIAKDLMKEGVTWNLMSIGQNSYSIFSMVGKKIIEYYEEPLALKSFVDDEIYNAIISSARMTMAGLPANYLFIASETDLVSAEVLAMKLPFEGQVKFLECNKYAQNELMPVNLNVLPNIAAKMSPEAIGIGIYPFSDFPLKFNIMGEGEITTGETSETQVVPKINVGGVEIELTPELTKKLSLIVSAVILVPLIIIYFVLNSLLGVQQAKLDALTQKITATNAEIEKYDTKTGQNVFDLNATIEKISTQNRLELFYYSALRLSVPNKLWITYYMTNSSKKVDIKGKATSVESVYSFYKNLKQLVTSSDIRLYKLEIVSESLEDVVDDIASSPKSYEFEITNMTAAELTPASADGTQPAAGAAAPTEQKKSLFDMGKSIFGVKSPSTPTGTDTATPPVAAPPPPPAPAATSSPAPSPSAPGSSGEQLPKNLKSIEKF